MAYPDRLLEEDERVVLRAQRHPGTLFTPAIVLFTVVTLAAYVVSLVDAPVVHAVVGVAAGGAVLRLTVTPYLRWVTAKCVVTTDRLLVREGVLVRTEWDIPLDDVAEVTLERTGWQRLIGTGTLLVETDDTELELPSLAGVEGVHETLCRLAMLPA